MGLTNQTGAEYLRQILRSPVYEVANVTPFANHAASFGADW